MNPGIFRSIHVYPIWLRKKKSLFFGSAVDVIGGTSEGRSPWVLGRPKGDFSTFPTAGFHKDGHGPMDMFSSFQCSSEVQDLVRVRWFHLNLGCLLIEDIESAAVLQSWTVEAIPHHSIISGSFWLETFDHGFMFSWASPTKPNPKTLRLADTMHLLG